MMIQFEDMDEFFREAAGSYELTPRETAWRRLRRQLLWRRFRYVIGAGVLSLVVLFMFLIARSGDESISALESSLPHTQADVALSNDLGQAIVTEKIQGRNTPVVAAAVEKEDSDNGIKGTFAVKGKRSAMESVDAHLVNEGPLQSRATTNSIGRLAPLSATLP